MEEEERTKVELQQKLTDIQNEDAQLKVSLQKKEGECVMDVHGPVLHAGNSRLDYTLHKMQMSWKQWRKCHEQKVLKFTSFKVSAYMFYTPSLRQGILLNHSYTDEMQTLKDMIERKDTELQQLLLGESEGASDIVCMS